MPIPKPSRCKLKPVANQFTFSRVSGSFVVLRPLKNSLWHSRLFSLVTVLTLLWHSRPSGHGRTIFIWVHCNPVVQFLYLNLALRTRKVAPRRQPIICKIKTNRDNVTCVFPRLRQFSWFNCEFVLATCDISLILIGFALSWETQSKGTQWLF